MIIFGPLFIVIPIVIFVWLYRSAKADMVRKKAASLDAETRETLRHAAQQRVDAYFRAHPDQRRAKGQTPHPDAARNIQAIIRDVGGLQNIL